MRRIHIFLLTILLLLGSVGFAFLEYCPHRDINLDPLEIGDGLGLSILTSDGMLAGRLLDNVKPDSVTIERYDAAGVLKDVVRVVRHDLKITHPHKGTPWLVFSGNHDDLAALQAEIGAASSRYATQTVPGLPGGLVFTNSTEPIKPSPEPTQTDSLSGVEDTREQRLRNQLRPASLAHNLPERMVYGQTVRVELALAPDRSGLKALEQLQNPIGAKVVNGIQHSLRMEAVLSGEGFRIEQSGDAARLILPDRSEVWTWHVTPQTFGTRMLDLEVFAVLEADGTNLPPTRIRSFATTVDVDIGSVDKVKLFLNEIPVLQQVIVVVLTAVLGPIGTFMMWLRLFPSKTAAANQTRRKIVRRK